jgi:hypothetical protein
MSHGVVPKIIADPHPMMFRFADAGLSPCSLCALW